MKPDTLILQLAALGISMSVNGEQLELRPGSMVSKELQDEIRLCKFSFYGIIKNPAVTAAASATAASALSGTW